MPKLPDKITSIILVSFSKVVNSKKQGLDG